MMPLILVMPLLAYRLFLDPLPLATYWLMLMPPMAIAVAVVYKTVRVHDLADLPRQATVLSVQIIAFLLLAAAALWLVTELA